MPSTPASQERVDLQFGLLLDPARHPGLTSRQITDRVMAAVGKEFGDVGITGVRTAPRSAAFGEPAVGPIGPITTDWQVNVGKAGSAETVTGNPMTMTSGATGTINGTADQRLLDAVAVASQYGDLGKLDDDHDKAASRHMRHQQAAIKAVSGARSLLGPAVAEPLSEHIRALVSDVDKAASIGAGYASLTKRVLGELGKARRQVTLLREREADAVGVIRNTLQPGTMANGDSMLTHVYAIASSHAEKAYRERTVEEHLPQLLARPTTVEHEALFRRVLFLEERIEAAIASGILRTTTGRGWIRRAAQAEEDHVAESAGTYAAAWQRFWDDHRARTAEHLTPYGSLATLQIPGTDNPGAGA
jgi:hypothetical protein